jgi:hypothetical protein
MRRRDSIPPRRLGGGADRRRRHRHHEVDLAGDDPRQWRALSPVATVDIEDYIYETWGRHAAERTVSER